MKKYFISTAMRVSVLVLLLFFAVDVSFGQSSDTHEFTADEIEGFLELEILIDQSYELEDIEEAVYAVINEEPTDFPATITTVQANKMALAIAVTSGACTYPQVTQCIACIISCYFQGSSNSSCSSTAFRNLRKALDKVLLAKKGMKMSGSSGNGTPIMDKRTVCCPNENQQSTSPGTLRVCRNKGSTRSQPCGSSTMNTTSPPGGCLYTYSCSRTDNCVEYIARFMD